MLCAYVLEGMADLSAIRGGKATLQVDSTP
jgi:hypothetical protein